jgi:hypothetical protein
MIQQTLNFGGLTKKEQVLEYIREKGYARTSDVIQFGSSIFSNRAQRDMFQLSADGKIVALDQKEKVFRGFGNTKENVWKVQQGVNHGLD